MKLELHWHRPVPLRRDHSQGRMYSVDLEKVPPGPGIYVFARRWGASFEALYVGKSKQLRQRIHGHLNNLRLMRHLQEAKNGRRVILVGKPHTKGGQNMDKVLTVIERGLIRYYLVQGHDLVNHQGTRVQRHLIHSRGPGHTAIVPSRIHMELGRIR